MKKIAVCFYGKFCGTNSSGETQSFDLAYQHFKINVLKPNNNVDVFLHGWDDQPIESKKMIERIKPLAYILEPQKSFDHPYKDYDFVPNGPYNTKLCINNNYSRFYSLKSSIKQVDTSMYDLILISRYDCVFYEPINFDIFDNDKFYVSHWNHNHEGWGFNDAWFLGCSKIMNDFCKIYDRLDDYLDIKNGKYIHFLKSHSLNETNIGSGHPIWRYRIKELGLDDKVYCYGLEYETYGLTRRYNVRHNPWGRPNCNILIPEKYTF